MYRHLLIPTDGSEASLSALRSGMQLALRLQAQVSVLSVTPPWQAYADVQGLLCLEQGDYQQEMRRLAATHLGCAEQLARELGLPIQTHHVEGHQPWRAIIDQAAERHCDLLVMGSHGRGGMEKLLLGSETQKVLTHTTLPVLVVR